MTRYGVLCDICGQAVEYGGLASHRCHQERMVRI